MCASVVNACRGEELCVKAGQAQDRLVQLGKEKHGWMRGARRLAPFPLIHVGMCRRIGARSVAEGNFSFAALK